MSIIIKRKDIEKRLSDFCKVEEIANHLTEREKNLLFKISLKLAIDAVCYEKAGNKALGVNVAQSIVRNYWMSLLTGNAVRYLQKKGIRKPIIVEMGTGSGLNAIAALSINKGGYYIGVEINDLCIDFASAQFIKYKVEKKAEIIRGEYSKMVLDMKADIVINENFGPNLVEEQQIIASNAVQPYAHKNTVFVPSAMQIYGLFGGKRVNYEIISFNKKIPLRIEFKQILKRDKEIEFRLGYDIIDFQDKIALAQGKPDDFVSYLPVIGEPIIIKQKKGNRLITTFDFKARQIIID